MRCVSHRLGTDLSQPQCLDTSFNHDYPGKDIKVLSWIETLGSSICFVNVLLGVEAQQRCCLWNLVFLVQVKVEKHSFGSTVCQAREMYNILLFAYQGPPGAPGKDGLKVKSSADVSAYFFANVIISFITPLPSVIVELRSPKIVSHPLLLSETRYLRWCVLPTPQLSKEICQQINGLSTAPG